MMNLSTNNAGQESPSRSERLRRKAEEVISRIPSAQTTAYKDLSQAIEELSIYQAELEVQNEELLRAQHEYTELHKHYTDLYEFAPCGYVTINSQKLITQLNFSAATLLRTNRSEALGLGLSRFLHYDWGTVFNSTLLQAAKTNEKQSIEAPLSRQNDFLHWVRFDIEAKQDGDEAAKHWLITLVDITPQKQAEKKLEETIFHLREEVETRKHAETKLYEIKERYRAIVMDQKELVCRFDLNGKISFVNDAYCRYFGVEYSQILGTNFLPNIHKDDLHKVEGHFIGLTPSSTERTIEHRVVMPGGTVRWQQWSGKALCDELGNIYEYQAVGRDITDLKETEIKLRASLTTLNTVFDSIDALLYVRDLNSYDIILANNYLESQLGEVVGKKCWQATRVGQSGPCDDCPQDYLLDEYGQPDGAHSRELWNDINGCCYYTQDRVVQWVDGRLVHLQIATDITAQKRAEQELVKLNAELEQRVEKRSLELRKTHAKLLHTEKLAAIGRLSASIAHEFNNPLTGVTNIIYGIQSRASYDEEDGRLLKMAIKECHRMKDLINNLRDFKQPTTGKAEILNLNELLDSLLILSKKDFNTKKISIKKQYSDYLPEITAVRDQLKQVFLNLLMNAADACKNGGCITICTEKCDGSIKVRIEDNGHGIAPENLSLIFEPFFTTKPALKGTGLGLSVSHRIISEHGGNIEVESKPDEGTTFIVTLPIDGEKGETTSYPAR